MHHKYPSRLDRMQQMTWAFAAELDFLTQQSFRPLTQLQKPTKGKVTRTMRQTCSLSHVPTHNVSSDPASPVKTHTGPHFLLSPSHLETNQAINVRKTSKESSRTKCERRSDKKKFQFFLCLVGIVLFFLLENFHCETKIWSLCKNDPRNVWVECRRISDNFRLSAQLQSHFQFLWMPKRCVVEKRRKFLRAGWSHFIQMCFYF